MEMREKVGRGERGRKTAIQTDTGEKTKLENELRQPHR